MDHTPLPALHVMGGGGLQKLLSDAMELLLLVGYPSSRLAGSQATVLAKEEKIAMAEKIVAKSLKPLHGLVAASGKHSPMLGPS